MRSSQTLVPIMPVMLVLLSILGKITFGLALIMSQVLSQIHPLEHLATMAALYSFPGPM